MAIATIQSSIPTKPTVNGLSREDLEIGDVVTVDSLTTGTLYSWSLAYTPEGSTAAFSGSPVTKSPGTFTVDIEGSYLIRFQFTDSSGTTEQFVRLRALTSYGQLKLVAAGETPGVLNIPVDITNVGWADNQNYNLNKLLSLIQSTRPSLISTRFDFDYTVVTPQNIVSVSQNDAVVKVFIHFEQAFDDAAAIIEIGDSIDPDRFVLSTDTNTNTTNKYEVVTIDSISSNTNVTFTPSMGASTQGSGFILVLTHKSYS